MKTYKQENEIQEEYDEVFDEMNEINPETNVIPHSDIQSQDEEKLAQEQLLRKKTYYANKELEKLDQDFTKLKIRMGVLEFKPR